MQIFIIILQILQELSHNNFKKYNKMSKQTCSVPPIDFASFSKPTSTCIVKGDPNSRANINRPVSRGICIPGICTNPKCPKKQKDKQNVIWTCLGQGSFDMHQQVRKMFCFACKRKLTNITSAILYCCLLIVKGQIVLDDRQTIDEDNINDPQQIFEHFINLRDSFLVFGANKQEIVKWHYLKLKATQPKTCPQQHSLGKYGETFYDTWKCNGCNKTFESDKKEKAKCCQGCGYYLCWDCL